MSERRAGARLGKIVGIQIRIKKDLTVSERERLEGSKREIPNEKEENKLHVRSREETSQSLLQGELKNCGEHFGLAHLFLVPASI